MSAVPSSTAPTRVVHLTVTHGVTVSVDLDALTDQDVVTFAADMADLNFSATCAAAAAEQELQRRGID